MAFLDHVNSCMCKHSWLLDNFTKANHETITDKIQAVQVLLKPARSIRKNQMKLSESDNWNAKKNEEDRGDA